MEQNEALSTIPDTALEAAHISLPSILSILFYVLAVATYMALIGCLFQRYRKGSSSVELGTAIKQQMLRGFIIVIGLSITMVLFEDDFAGLEPLSLLPEAIMLLGLIAVCVLKQTQRGIKTAAVARHLCVTEPFRIMKLVISFAIFIGASIALILFFRFIFSVLTPGLSDLMAAMSLISFWLALPVLLYFAIRRKIAKGEIDNAKFLNPKPLLWGMILVLLLFMIPLLAEHIINSPGFEEWRNPPPVLRGA